VPEQDSLDSLERRLRAGLASPEADEGLPSDGTARTAARLRLLSSVHRRDRKRRQMLFGTAAAVIAVVATTLSLRSVESPSSKNFASRSQTSKVAASANAPSAPESNAFEQSRRPGVASASNLCVLVSLDGGPANCAGTTNDETGSTLQGNESSQESSGTSHPSASSGYGALPLSAKVGETITIAIPQNASGPGIEWTAPAVQASEPEGVTRFVSSGSSLSSRSNAANSSEASTALTLSFVRAGSVRIDAAELRVCGARHAFCGSPLRSWSLTVEVAR